MERNSLKDALKSSLKAEEEKLAERRRHGEEQEKKGKMPRKHKKHS